MRTKNLKVCLAASVLFLASVSTSVAKVIYVDANADFLSADDGTSWADAFRYLQDALRVASTGDRILVAQGVYKPDQGVYQPPCERTATFQLINGVAIRGGYAGFGEPDPHARNIELYETILSGDLRGNDSDFNDSDWQHVFDYTSDPNLADNSYSVVTGSGTDSSAVLDGFTITGGNANGPILGKYSALDYRLAAGAGMYNASGSPTVLNCTFRRNTTRTQYGCSGNGCTGGAEAEAVALDAGGSFYCSCGYVAESCGAGMFNCSSSPTLRNCTFEENISFGADAFSAGAGMMNIDSNPALTDCTFSRNLVTGFDSEYNGGGMYNYRSSPTLADCSFIGNVSEQSATGAMVNTENSNATLTNCTFIGNTAREGAGAMSISGSDAVLVNCTFIDNSGYFGGAILIGGHCKPELVNCTFVGNSASEGGAVLTSFRSSASIIGCTFSSNSAGEGGAIHNHGAWYNDPNSHTVIAGCTFSANSASRGGGMYNAWNRKTAVRNCVFAGNFAYAGGGVHYYGSEQHLTNCTFAENAAENGNAVACDSHDAGYPSNVRIANCIIWNDEGSVFNGDGSNLQITWSDVEGGWPGEGNLDLDPCFADPNNGDYHLLSERGRYWPEHDVWVLDKVTSPCIDAGDPYDDPSAEPMPNGDLVNMGAYGGTPYASMSEWALRGDINHDGIVNMIDFSIFADYWLQPSLRAREIDNRLACANNLRALGRALRIYANDYDDEYPTADQWCDLLLQRESDRVTEEMFVCPSAEGGPSHYAINPNAKGWSHPDMVLLFETTAGWNQFGGPELLAPENHQGEGSHILFHDGHVEFVQSERFDELRWE